MTNIPTERQNQDPSIRALRLDDLDSCLALSTEAGWNQNENDWRLLLQVCSGYGIDVPGYGLAGTTMAWELGERNAWINMVLVAKAYRGRGFARELMAACLGDLASAQRLAMLDATDLGFNVYSKFGFSGKNRIARLYRESETESSAPISSSADGLLLKPMRAEDIDQVANLDLRVIGIDRENVLADFYRRESEAAWVARDVSGSLRGFVLGRDGRIATQIGPIVAETRTVAEALLRHSLSQIASPVFVDAPMVNTKWVETLKHFGFAPQREFLRMGIDGTALATDWSRTYAICGPDLG
ncbi:MAG: GNAT family N-acetyltransferase [Opitutaceae bacterium]|nr:GNAT family N-acetyltransferase [Opitutaceae bacterium]